MPRVGDVDQLHEGAAKKCEVDQASMNTKFY